MHWDLDDPDGSTCLHYDWDYVDTSVNPSVTTTYRCYYCNGSGGSATTVNSL